MPAMHNAAPILKAQADMIRAAADLVESGSGVVKVDIVPNSLYTLVPGKPPLRTAWAISIEVVDERGLDDPCG